jgi:N-carbamoyl-L-amino-acid hydrolase
MLRAARKIFCERLPRVARAYGRQTERAAEIVRLVGYVAGGLPAQRLLQRLSIAACDDIDAAGNIVGARPGSEAALRPLLVGSHIDSVPMGGNYDGDVGSISAIEVAQVLSEGQITLRHPLEVIIFQNEEGGTIGSQALGRGLDKDQLNEVSQSGKTIREGSRLIGGNLDQPAAARR